MHSGVVARDARLPMSYNDSPAHRLIEQFFTQRPPVSDQARLRWHTSRELDWITINQIRVWAANRALASFSPGSSPTDRARTMKDRAALERWLDASKLDSSARFPESGPADGNAA